MRNKNYELPLGLSRQLAQNETALINFAGMSPQQKLAIKEQAMQATSKSEMQRIVQNIADNSFFWLIANKRAYPNMHRLFANVLDMLFKFLAKY